MLPDQYEEPESKPFKDGLAGESLAYLLAFGGSMMNTTNRTHHADAMIMVPMYCRNWDECSGFALRPRKNHTAGRSHGSYSSYSSYSYGAAQPAMTSRDAPLAPSELSYGGAPAEGSVEGGSKLGSVADGADPLEQAKAAFGFGEAGVEDVGEAGRVAGDVGTGAVAAGAIVIAGAVGPAAQQIATIAITEGVHVLIGSVLALVSGLVMITRLPQLPGAMYLGVEMWMFFAALSSSSIFLRVCHMTLDDVLISQKYINVIFFFLCAYIFLCMIALVIPPQIIKLALLILTQCAFFAGLLVLNIADVLWPIAILKLLLMFVYAQCVIIFFLHAIHTFAARWELMCTAASCFVGAMVPAWLNARLLSWSNMAIGIFTTSVVVPTLVIELNNRIATDLKDGGCYASLSCDQPFEGEKAAKAGFDTLLGVAASVATAAAAFAITGGGCECVPPIPVLWCINMGSSAAAGFCALMAFILFGMAEFFTLLSLVKANDLTLVASLIIAFFLLLKILLDSVYVLTTMLPGLKLVAFFVGQVIFAVTLAIFYFDEIVDNYWFKTHGNYDLQDYVPGLNTFSDDGQPWAIPVRISLIFFFSTAATISFCSFAQCANELVHTIPGLGCLIDALGLGVVGAVAVTGATGRGGVDFAAYSTNARAVTAEDMDPLIAPSAKPSDVDPESGGIAYKRPEPPQRPRPSKKQVESMRGAK